MENATTKIPEAVGAPPTSEAEGTAVDTTEDKQTSKDDFSTEVAPVSASTARTGGDAEKVPGKQVPCPRSRSSTDIL